MGAVAVLLAAISPRAAMAATSGENARGVADLVEQELRAKYPGTRIEVAQPVTLPGGVAAAKVQGVFLARDNQRGKAVFRFRVEEMGVIRHVESEVSYTAWMMAPVAKVRVRPGMRLSADQFQVREINISDGMNSQLYGLILPVDTVFEQLEAMNTILEGQSPLSHAVRRVPDLKRGELVQVKISSGGLIVSVPAVLQDSAYSGGQARVLTQKTKRELVGTLSTDRQVEVSL